MDNSDIYKVADLKWCIDKELNSINDKSRELNKEARIEFLLYLYKTLEGIKEGLKNKIEVDNDD